MLKEEFDNWRVGMLVFLKINNHIMTVEKFYMDDFSNRFCDRMDCSWFEGEVLKHGNFKYDDIDIVGVHTPEQ